jgi:hypothetical protein
MEDKMDMNLSKQQREHVKTLQTTTSNQNRQMRSMQLIIDKLTKELEESYIANVSGSKFEPTDEQIEQASKKYLEVIWDIPKDNDEFQLCDEYKEAFIGMLKILKESV